MSRASVLLWSVWHSSPEIKVVGWNSLTDMRPDKAGGGHTVLASSFDIKTAVCLGCYAPVNVVLLSPNMDNYGAIFLSIHFHQSQLRTFFLVLASCRIC